jgi:hypothetical protein
MDSIDQLEHIMQEEIVLAFASGMDEEEILRVFDISHRELEFIILSF